jgi:hypothetical protein
MTRLAERSACGTVPDVRPRTQGDAAVDDVPAMRFVTVPLLHPLRHSGFQIATEAAPDFSETASDLRCYPVGMTGFEPAAP